VRPRVLFVCTTLGVGGAEHVVARLGAGLAGRFEVEAASLLPPPAAGGAAAALRARGVPVHDLGGARKLLLPRALARLTVLARRADVVASFLFHANLLSRAARALARPRRPALVVSLRIAEPGRPWRLAAERFTAPLADRIVCVSQALRRAARGAADPRYITIPNGVPIPVAPAPLAPGAPWVAVGRLERQKGHDVLIEAWRLLGASAPPLRIAGGGPLAEALRARAAGLPIEFLGPRDDVPELLAGAGGFVLASREEGLSNAMLEAMAAGLPVVVTAVGGAPEALSGGAGLLVPREAPAALAAAVREVAGDRARARALGAAARARAAARYAEAQMVSAWGDLLADLAVGWRCQTPRV
jgi:glycosyltransferase involved in cell wall biosynthesis